MFFSFKCCSAFPRWTQQLRGGAFECIRSWWDHPTHKLLEGVGHHFILGEPGTIKDNLGGTGYHQGPFWGDRDNLRIIWLAISVLVHFPKGSKCATVTFPHQTCVEPEFPLNVFTSRFLARPMPVCHLEGSCCSGNMKT